MAKNESAAKVRAGGKTQERTGPDAVGQDATNTAAQDKTGTDGQQDNASSSTGNPAPPNVSPNGIEQAGSSSDSTAQDVGNQQASQPADSLRLMGQSGPELEYTTGGLLDIGLHRVGEAPTGAFAGSSIASVLRSTPGLKVTSLQAGFRRAGRAWSTTPTVIALSDLTRDDVDALRAEPMLSVEPTFIDPEEA